MSDNEHLINLVLQLRAGVTEERKRELKRQLDRCQNRDTCDGTVTEDVWRTARSAYEAADSLLVVLDAMSYIRH